METQHWDDRGRLTVRPEYRQRLGNPAFLQVLTPHGLLFVPIPDKPASWGGKLRSGDDAGRLAQEQWEKDWREKNDRIRRHKPRPRSR